MAPLEALSAIAGAGEGTAVARVIERLLSGLRRGVRCIPESLQNHEITNSNLLVSIQVYSRIVSHFIPKILVYRCLSVHIGQSFPRSAAFEKFEHFCLQQSAGIIDQRFATAPARP